MFIVLITKSYDKSVWCNFSVHCRFIAFTFIITKHFTLYNVSQTRLCLMAERLTTRQRY